jgi:hypothetical protein
MKECNLYSLKRLLMMSLVLIVLASCNNSSENQKKEKIMKNTDELPTFVIEREIENIGSSTPEELKKGSKKSNSAIEELGPDIQWIHSYVSDNKLYCVYQAKDKELIKEHAKLAGVPANSISRVTAKIDPSTAE